MFEGSLADLERYFHYKHLMSEKDLLKIKGFSELKDIVKEAESKISEYLSSKVDGKSLDGVKFLRGGVDKDASGRPLKKFYVKLQETDDHAVFYGLDMLKDKYRKFGTFDKWAYSALHDGAFIIAPAKEQAIKIYFDEIIKSLDKLAESEGRSLDRSVVTKLMQYAQADDRGFSYDPDKGYVIAEIHTKGAACALGKEADWCTASPTLEFFNSYYKKDDPLYFFFEEDSNEIFQFSYSGRDFATKENVQADADIQLKLHTALLETDAANNPNVKKETMSKLLGASESAFAKERLEDHIKEYTEEDYNKLFSEEITNSDEWDRDRFVNRVLRNDNVPGHFKDRLIKAATEIWVKHSGTNTLMPLALSEHLYGYASSDEYKMKIIEDIYVL